MDVTSIISATSVSQWYVYLTVYSIVARQGPTTDKWNNRTYFFRLKTNKRKRNNERDIDYSKKKKNLLVVCEVVLRTIILRDNIIRKH